VNIRKRHRCWWRIWRYENNFCVEISEDHRRRRGSSQDSEKGKETGEIRQRAWKRKSVRKEDCITFGAQRTLVLADSSNHCSLSSLYVLGMCM